MAEYTEESIRSLDWKEHIRLRPGMYIGKLGDGSAADDGIYVLLKEVIDNCIDEFRMGHGKRIDITIENGRLSVRDLGRGIPLGKLKECVSQINTGAKYDSKTFQKSVGLNGVGTKAVNALSGQFAIQAWREGQTRRAEFARGELQEEDKRARKDKAENGTLVEFQPDSKMFGAYQYRMEYVEKMLQHYAYLNTGLTLTLNGRKFSSKNGLLDLLTEEVESEEALYPIIHLKGADIEVAFTHTAQYGEEYYSFVNGQHTTQGGTHQTAFRGAVVKTIRDFFKKNYESSDIRTGMVAAISVLVTEPVFESQTKTKLGSLTMEPDGLSIQQYVANFLAKELDNYLHRHESTAKAMLEKIVQTEKERTALKGIQKLARERARKAKVHNRKLRDCRAHLGEKHKRAEESTLFITEGDSASGSITAARDVETQAVFSLRGKPLNCFGLTKRVVYENEEFNLLQHALNIEDDLEELRYNRVVLATDADVDGMHIRLLLISFFLQFFPDLIKKGHLYILQTPLFRVRNKKETRYCYNDAEREKAIADLGPKPEITRFKGLGEIDSSEFKHFIGEDIRLDPVIIGKETKIKDLLSFYMGKNTPDRQNFIIENLRIETDLAEENKESLAVAAG